ncbi:MAG TPA: MATE family efflux transporter [Bacteroidales bacterium]|nr:MATE family efflux transporter [Bacteroidales bacterium]
MKDLTQGNELRLITSFALPMLLGNLFQQMYSFTDSAIVGKFVGNEALAAVGASFPLIFVLIALAVGVANGINIIISQYFGAKDYAKIKASIDTLYLFCAIAGVVLTITGFVISEPIFRLINTPEAVMPQAVSYFRIYAAGFVLMFGYYATAGILRGLGDSRTPLYFLILSTIINIGLDLLFILVFGWGIQGAAIATVISQGVAFIMGAWYLRRKGSIINLHYRSFVFDRQIFRQAIRVGLPSGMQQTFVALGGILLYWIVNDFGTATMAGYSAAMRIDSLASLPAMQLAAALSTFVGQNIGANRMDRVRRGFINTWWMSTGFSIVVTLVVVLFRTPLMSLFTNDPAVIESGNRYLVIVCAFYIIFSSMFITNGVLRGAGATIIPMFITLISIWILRIPVSYLMSRDWTGLGEMGIWWGIPVAWAFGAIASYAYYLSGKWKKYAVVRHEEVEEML